MVGVDMVGYDLKVLMLIGGGVGLCFIICLGICRSSLRVSISLIRGCLGRS